MTSKAISLWLFHDNVMGPKSLIHNTSKNCLKFDHRVMKKLSKFTLLLQPLRFFGYAQIKTQLLNKLTKMS